VQDKLGATFTSGQLATQAMFEGYPVLHLRVGASGPQANVFAYLEDVAPNGDAAMVGFGRLALSHRKLGRAPYKNFDLPYHSGLRADVSPAVSGQLYTLDFALSPRSYTFAAGHRIRVRVTGADPRQRNLAEIKGDLAKTITLATDAQSRIEIPFEQPPAFR
jgi:predicted acyl esterase